MTFRDHWRIQSRRDFFQRCAGGIETIALAHLLQQEGRSAGQSGPLAPKKPHFPAKAKNVIFLFMAGAPSQLDLYDYKPKMRDLHGQPVPPSVMKELKDDLIRGSARVMASPREFRQAGPSGMWFSDYIPHIAGIAGDLSMVHSFHTDVANHHPAQMMMNCGTPLVGRPSMGSWVTYGLGSETQDLPGYIVLLSSSGKGIEGGASNWSNGFLPSNYRGVTFRSSGDPVLHLSNPPGLSTASQRLRLEALRDLNDQRKTETGDYEISSRIHSYELAFRMQAQAPELLDLRKEDPATLNMYGIANEKSRAFGTNCLLARRMVERGVRFVQLYHSTWDDHSDLNSHLRTNTEIVDQPSAALVRDLKRRGLLDSTLVVWGGEFGRTPMNEVRRGNTAGKEGRDHHRFAFTMWMTGGGIQPGRNIGETDELGFNIASDPYHVHDLQATILHCLGMDHTRLTYRHQGRDFRLTDVDGQVIRPLLS
ncbi:MAG TPA: DUF1501 domain-containing protein [Bryobacteraceae bacterium]|nr:DUF1501 domain-containing protein [Bryobacteraceae bacterium]